MSYNYPGDSSTLTKAQVATCEGDTITVEAYFNPDKLSISKTVNWTDHKATDSDAPPKEFTQGTGQSLSVSLTIDGFEDCSNVYASHVQKLFKMALIDPNLKRPPLVTFTWGSALPVFKGVMMSVKAEYNMWAPDGTPIRARVDLTIAQADKAMTKAEADADNKRQAQKQGKTVSGPTTVNRNQTATAPNGQPAQQNSMGQVPAGSTVSNS